ADTPVRGSSSACAGRAPPRARANARTVVGAKNARRNLIGTKAAPLERHADRLDSIHAALFVRSSGQKGATAPTHVKDSPLLGQFGVSRVNGRRPGPAAPPATAGQPRPVAWPWAGAAGRPDAGWARRGPISPPRPAATRATGLSASRC